MIDTQLARPGSLVGPSPVYTAWMSVYTSPTLFVPKTAFRLMMDELALVIALLEPESNARQWALVFFDGKLGWQQQYCLRVERL